MHLLGHQEYRNMSLAQTVYHHSRSPSSGGQTIEETQAETQELVVLVMILDDLKLHEHHHSIDLGH